MLRTVFGGLFLVFVFLISSLLSNGEDGEDLTPYRDLSPAQQVDKGACACEACACAATMEEEILKNEKAADVVDVEEPKPEKVVEKEANVNTVAQPVRTTRTYSSSCRTRRTRRTRLFPIWRNFGRIRNW